MKLVNNEARRKGRVRGMQDVGIRTAYALGIGTPRNLVVGKQIRQFLSGKSDNTTVTVVVGQ